MLLLIVQNKMFFSTFRRSQKQLRRLNMAINKPVHPYSVSAHSKAYPNTRVLLFMVSEDMHAEGNIWMHLDI